METPKVTTAIFGLGDHDLQPRHLIAAFKNMEAGDVPFVYLALSSSSKFLPRAFQRCKKR